MPFFIISIFTLVNFIEEKKYDLGKWRKGNPISIVMETYIFFSLYMRRKKKALIRWLLINLAMRIYRG